MPALLLLVLVAVAPVAAREQAAAGWGALQILERSVEPGSKSMFPLAEDRNFDSAFVNSSVWVVRGEQAGPTLCITAGIHGDEINGVEIVRRTIAHGYFEQLQRGSVIAIPLLNVYGFINFSREVPDGKDVNRSFPGNLKGSLASRVARTLTKKVLPLIDFGVDFHTGGRNHYNFPQVRYTKNDPKAGELAAQFAAPFTLGKSPLAKSLRKVARDAGKPILVYEGGENQRFDGFSIEKGLAGLRRVLAAQDMIAEKVEPEDTLYFTQTTWIRAARAGLFRWSKRSGHAIRRGEPLGVINDPYGMDEIPVVAPRDGYIVGHNNAPVVSTGDALFHVAY